MIYQGDSLQLLKHIETDSIDFILTDPPYGIGYVNHMGTLADKSIKNDTHDAIDWNTLLQEMWRILKPNSICFIFGRTDMFMRIGQAIIDSDFKYNHDFIWRKGDMRGGNLSLMGTIHETAIALSKGTPKKCNSIYINQKLKNRYKAEYHGKISRLEYTGHPTQKPVNMLTYIINAYSNKGDTVLDPFMGSGSTAVACKVTDRHFIGIDLDQDYVDMTARRLEDTSMLNLYSKQVETGYLYSDEGLLKTNKLKQ